MQRIEILLEYQQIVITLPRVKKKISNPEK